MFQFPLDFPIFYIIYENDNRFHLELCNEIDYERIFENKRF